MEVPGLESLREAPNTWAERSFCMAAAAGALAGMVWLSIRIAGALDRNHTPEFVAMALLIGLLLYLGWVLLALWTVRYSLAGGKLLLEQGPVKTEIPLGRQAHLHRWRSRWMWEGGAQKDLGVSAVAFFPPLWLLRGKEIWVLQHGEKAVAFRPSAKLLAAIKQRVREPGARTG